MEPYFQNEQVTIWHADVRTFMPDGPFDLLVTDPPYGQNWKSGRSDRHDVLQGDDGTLDVQAVLTDVAKRVRRGRHGYVFGQFDLDGTAWTAATDLIWNKDVVGLGNLQLPWGTSHEPIMFVVNEPSKANRAKGYGRLAARMRKQSVITCPRVQGGATGRHPTEKPVALLRELVESSSSFGETVFDPFVGSGSTVVAAVLEGRHAVGVDVDERYCEIAAERARRACEHVSRQRGM